jgi:hypothetical protein
VRFTFDKSVDDPEYIFLYPSPEGLGPVQLPEVGERRRYRKATFPNAAQPVLRAEREPNVSCRGVRPTIDACRSGFGFSDCGGSSQPVFGCTWHDDCRWFVHGCVAEDYEVTECPARDPCCLKGWPFEDFSFTHQLHFTRTLVETLGAFGNDLAKLDSEFALAVNIVPKLPARRSELRCSGPRPAGGPCGTNLVDVADAEAQSLRFVYRSPRPSDGWALTVEMIEARSGERHARVCRVRLPELWTAAPEQRACRIGEAPVCAERGNLTLNAFPIYPGMLTWLRGTLQADFADGLHVEAEL